MKKAIIVLAAIFLSCGGKMTKEECPGDWYYEDVAGLTICSEGKIDTNEIKYAVQVVEQQAAIRYPEVNNLVETLREHEVSVFFIDDDLAVGCDQVEHDIYRCEEHIGGANYNGDRLYVRYYSCLAWTSLGHELLHSIEKYYLGGGVGDHETPWLFEENYSDNYQYTVEYKIFMDLYLNVASCDDR